MGLDQYAYAAFERGERRRVLPGEKRGEYVFEYKQPHGIAYWRNHRYLLSWMADLWNEKGQPYANTDVDPRWVSMFNGAELELTWEDIQRLEDDIKNCRKGFSKSCPYREDDLQFCLDAKEQLFLYRKRIFYYSNW